MKTIYLVRHAKSSWDAPSLPDMVRPLNARGLDASEKMGKYLREQGYTADILISSPATRALHTAINIASGLGIIQDDIHTDNRLYFKGFLAMIELLRELPGEVASVMLFSHEPDIGQLAEALTGEQLAKFPTCAVYAVVMDLRYWELLEEHTCRKLFFLLPRQLFS